MYDEDTEIASWEQVFTNMNVDIHDASWFQSGDQVDGWASHEKKSEANNRISDESHGSRASLKTILAAFKLRLVIDDFKQKEEMKLSLALMPLNAIAQHYISYLLHFVKKKVRICRHVQWFFRLFSTWLTSSHLVHKRGFWF